MAAMADCRFHGTKGRKRFLKKQVPDYESFMSFPAPARADRYHQLPHPGREQQLSSALTLRKLHSRVNGNTFTQFFTVPKYAG
jgi:hypothetical protein